MFIISADVSRMVTHLTDFLEMGRHVTFMSRQVSGMVLHGVSADQVT